jgi:hypothetical protein
MGEARKPRMSRRTRAVVDAVAAVVLTVAVVLVLYAFTAILSTPPLVRGRVWWVVAWAVLVVITAAMLARRPTAVRHATCTALTVGVVMLHLIAYWTGLVHADAPTPALILTDLVFCAAAIASLTLVNIRRREYREIDEP